ncbi:MAG: aldehyde dehydrogenase family protein [Nocardioides sp.]
MYDPRERERIDVRDPATGNAIDDVPRGTVEDVEDAVSRAVDAFATWRRLPTGERAGLLHGVASGIRSHQDSLARLLTLESGKPLRDSVAELDLAAETFDFYAEVGRTDVGRMIAPGDPDQIDFTRYEPYGVTACITPWNFPLQLLAWKMAPALAAGNPVVVLPSPLTPLATLKFAEVATGHLPPGVVSVLTGFGPEVGEALVLHRDVPHIALTGSVQTGQVVMAQAAKRLKKLTLELGGKDPLVVAPDMSVDEAVPPIAFAGLLHAGQCCTSTERVYVPRASFEEFTEALAAFVSVMRLGPGMDSTTDMGPLINNDAVDRVASQVDEAVIGGARLVTGGRREGVEGGSFYAPTVLAHVDPSSRLMREEIFGPVLPISPYDDFDHVIAMANDSEFGLAASLLTRDAALAKRFYEEVDAGTIYINDPLTPNYAAPFGGMKSSGLGRELGVEGLDQFRQVKHVHWDVVGRAKDAWRTS